MKLNKSWISSRNGPKYLARDQAREKDIIRAKSIKQNLSLYTSYEQLFNHFLLSNIIQNI